MALSVEVGILVEVVATVVRVEVQVGMVRTGVMMKGDVIVTVIVLGAFHRRLRPLR